MSYNIYKCISDITLPVHCVCQSFLKTLLVKTGLWERTSVWPSSITRQEALTGPKCSSTAGIWNQEIRLIIIIIPCSAYTKRSTLAPYLKKD